jgi:hypothetical protein
MGRQAIVLKETQGSLRRVSERRSLAIRNAKVSGDINLFLRDAAVQAQADVPKTSLKTECETHIIPSRDGSKFNGHRHLKKNQFTVAPFKRHDVVNYHSTEVWITGVLLLLLLTP